MDRLIFVIAIKYHLSLGPWPYIVGMAFGHQGVLDSVPKPSLLLCNSVSAIRHLTPSLCLCLPVRPRTVAVIVVVGVNKLLGFFIIEIESRPSKITEVVLEHQWFTVLHTICFPLEQQLGYFEGGTIGSFSSPFFHHPTLV